MQRAVVSSGTKPSVTIICLFVRPIDSSANVVWQIVEAPVSVFLPHSLITITQLSVNALFKTALHASWSLLKT